MLAPMRVVVVGGGTMGLASAWALARRGAAVTVVERFGHIHERGSHGGHTRIIRHAYHEGASYVGLVRRADAEWRALSTRVGSPILDPRGVLFFGPCDDSELAAAIETSRSCGVPTTLLSGPEIGARWPFVVPGDWCGCLDHAGGILDVKAGLNALALEARHAGATFRYGQRVVDVASGASIRVCLEDGDVLMADAVVIAAGAWTSSFLPSLGADRWVPQRRYLVWVTPAPEAQPALAALPVWCAYLPRGFFYGFPYGHGGVAGLKIAVHTSQDLWWLGQREDPEVARSGVELPSEEWEALQQVLASHLPSALGPVLTVAPCLYTQSPTGDFTIDRSPLDARIVIAGGFSGHGFKFAPAIGLHVSDLVLDAAAPYPAFAFTRTAEP